MALLFDLFIVIILSAIVFIFSPILGILVFIGGLIFTFTIGKNYRNWFIKNKNKDLEKIFKRKG